jgi:hypothetical protein
MHGPIQSHKTVPLSCSKFNVAETVTNTYNTRYPLQNRLDKSYTCRGILTVLHMCIHKIVILYAQIVSALIYFILFKSATCRAENVGERENILLQQSAVP